MVKKCSSLNTKSNPVVIVFDLDETLGFFSEFSLLWNYLQSKNQNMQISGIHTQLCFNDLFDNFPELLRPLIVDILKSLLRKKNHYTFELMLYTNNNGSKSWIQHIVQYLEYKISKDLKLSSTLFLKIIYAFKINGKRIELKRTSCEKSYNDFLLTTALPNTTQVCFIDDTYFINMDVKNVFYINVEPYIYNFTASEYISRIKNSYCYNKYYTHINDVDLFQFLKSKLYLEKQHIKKKNMTKDEKDIAIIDSKAIWKFLNEFLLEFCSVK